MLEESVVAAQPPPLPDDVSCPKLNRASAGYRYYPGFSRAFVRDILEEWPKGDIILDPWNGSGTTTTVASELGHRSVGIDLNPAMVVIARAALLSADDVAELHRKAGKLKRLTSGTGTVERDDPLLEWLDWDSVARVRSFLSTFVGTNRLRCSDVMDLGATTAFWLTAVIQMVREATTGWRTSNPTWIKSGHGSQPVELTWDEVIDFRHMRPRLSPILSHEQVL